MNKITLAAEKRNTLGKKVKILRQKGIVPGNIFGKNIDSLAIQIEEKKLQVASEDAGSSSLIYLKVNGDTERPVLMQKLQKHPVTGLSLHVDFRQVDLKEKVTAVVPLEGIGKSPVVTDKQGLLLWIIDELEVKALPTDLPEKIEVDITGLTQIGQEILVKDLKIDPSKITITAGPEEVVLKLESLISEEMQKELAEEEAKKAEVAAAAEATSAPVAGAEGQPAEPKKPAAVEKPKE